MPERWGWDEVQALIEHINASHSLDESDRQLLKDILEVADEAIAALPDQSVAIEFARAYEPGAEDLARAAAGGADAGYPPKGVKGGIRHICDGIRTRPPYRRDPEEEIDE